MENVKENAHIEPTKAFDMGAGENLQDNLSTSELITQAANKCFRLMGAIKAYGVNMNATFYVGGGGVCSSICEWSEADKFHEDDPIRMMYWDWSFVLDTIVDLKTKLHEACEAFDAEYAAIINKAVSQEAQDGKTLD